MSYYVRRMKTEAMEPTRLGWIGPIRSANQAAKEVAAWESCGWDAEVFESTPEVKSTVRAWVKAVKS